MSPRAYNELPDEVASFLSGVEAYDQAKRFVAEFGLSDAAVPAVMAAVEMVVTGEETLEAFPDLLASVAGVPEGRKDAAAVALAQARLLPISSVVGDVRGAIIRWGGSVEPAAAAASVAMKTEALADEVLEGAGLHFSDPVMEHRLRLIVSSYLDGSRDASELLSALTRPHKVGGAELSADDAQALKTVIDAKRPAAPVPPASKPELKVAVRVVKPTAPAPKPAAPPLPPTPAAPSPFVPKPLTPVSVSIPVKAAPKTVPVPPKPAPLPPKPAPQKPPVKPKPTPVSPVRVRVEPQTEEGKFAAQIATAANLNFADEDERTRFLRIVESRVRDVRDAYETRAQLEASKERGGLGLSGAQLAAVSETVERLVGERRHAMAAQAVVEKAKTLQTKAQETSVRQAREGAAQQEQLARRYQALTGKAPAAEGMHPTLARQEEQIDTAKMKAAARQASPTMSPRSIPAAPGQVQDVRFRPRLAGPLEELRGLTLVEWRRLSADPKQAATKVRAKLALLDDQGYERKLAAVKAWRESPINRQYLDLTRAALVSGRPMEALLREKSTTDGLIPTLQEIDAIRELNAELRF